MIFFESIRVALAALWANKLRALLTMLGVIIGVTSRHRDDRHRAGHPAADSWTSSPATGPI